MIRSQACGFLRKSVPGRGIFGLEIRIEDNEETESGVATVWDQGREGHVMKTEKLAISATAEPCELW